MDIVNESVRLHRIVENLLLLARFEQGKLVDREPVIVVDVVNEIVARHRRGAPSRQFDIVEAGERRPVPFPQGYLELIVENLVTNAEKYSASDTPIRIEVERLKDEVRLLVLDEGIGIGEVDITQVFEAFYRSSSASGRAGGIGIGLTVCRRLVEAVGGEIWVRKREGGGSEFGFSLPVGRDQTYAPN